MSLGSTGHVAVVIPTLRRPDSLARALRSLFAQQGVESRIGRIVVADNDPTASAHDVCESLAAASPWPLVHVHAPVPGVATARNVGLGAAGDAALIAFLDDDEAASPRWLAALLATQAATGADVVFGPIRGRAPDAAPWLNDYMQAFFGREGPQADALLDQPFGCGNSLMVRATALPGATPFDTGADQIGGEDDILFAGLKARGGGFAWSADAWVEEFAPPHRATLRYALARAFAYGQGPSQTAAAAGRPLGVARWMAIGVAQAGVWGLASLAAFVVRAKGRARLYDRAARGLGKVFWGRAFEPRFYGASELARLDATA